MEVYPAVPKPAYSYILDHQFKTLVTDSDTGTEYRNQRWRFPKRTFSLTYKLQTFSTAQRDAIYEFYQNRLGIYESFWYFDIQSRKWLDQKVGDGDGATLTFDLPGNGTVSAVYIDGVLKTGGGTDYTFISGGGEGGADRIQFVTAPADETLITADFTGYLRIKGRFKDDKLTEEIVTTHLVNFTTSIYEIKNRFSITLSGYLMDISGNLILDMNGNPISEVG